MMDDFDFESRSMQSASSSIGEAVSGRGQNESVEGEDEGEELYYIPERRPSLDLGPTPMDMSNWHFVDQALSPALSYSSLATEESSSRMDDADCSFTRVELSRADSFSSCYSLDSDDCEKRIPKVKSKDDTVSERPVPPELIHDPNEIPHPSLTVNFTFTAISDTLKKLTDANFKKFKNILWRRYPQSFNAPPKTMDLVDIVDRLLERYKLEVSLKITKTLLGEIGQKKLVDALETMCLRNEVQYDLRKTLKRKYGEVSEDLAMHGPKRPFEDVYTKLHITSTCDNGPNIEHEVLTIGKLDTNREAGNLITPQYFLCPERLERSNLKLLLIIGAAGSGKSTAFKRLVLDWIEGRSHQHVYFLIPLPFRELKQFDGLETSLVEMIQTLYPETTKLREEDYRCEDDCKMMFIFDGLDELKGKLDFEHTRMISDQTSRGTLNTIVVNLLRGRLVYRGLFLIFSRPLVKRSVPWDTHYDEVDVRGFLDPEKDDYFKKRFQDPNQAARVIAYINSMKTIRIMCHLPLFCSLVAEECERLFREQGTQVAVLPRSLTYMFTKLLLTLTRVVRETKLSQEKEIEFLMKLGKLAFNLLEKGEFSLIRCDWKEEDIDDQEAVSDFGLCMQFITKPHVLCLEKVLSFVHPTMQEYLAALYVFLSFRNLGKNILEQQLKSKLKVMFKGNKGMELYKSAVDRSLQCEDGKLDLFLRFLCGMAVKTNLELLKPFCSTSSKWQSIVGNIETLIMKRIKENQYPGRNSNLQRCLEELGVERPEQHPVDPTL